MWHHRVLLCKNILSLVLGQLEISSALRFFLGNWKIIEYLMWKLYSKYHQIQWSRNLKNQDYRYLQKLESAQLTNKFVPTSAYDVWHVCHLLIGITDSVPESVDYTRRYCRYIRVSKKLNIECFNRKIRFSRIYPRIRLSRVGLSETNIW